MNTNLLKVINQITAFSGNSIRKQPPIFAVYIIAVFPGAGKAAFGFDYPGFIVYA
jgi:hypothetical protein